jgi:CHAD domain-containing protein
MAKAKIIEGLDCDGDAESGILLVLCARFDEMASHRDAAALDWKDPEGVHDMRVASRRLRSALRDFSPYIREQPLKTCAKQIREIAQCLGRVRDLDVSIATLEKLASRCPADVLPGIQRLIQERIRRREPERNSLERIIAKERFEQLVSQFLQASRRATRPKVSKNKDNGNEPSFRETSREIIAKRADELERIGSTVFEPFRQKRLHRMRIAAKRVRYSIQLFAQCLPDAVNAVVEPVARLQGNLGDLHDADVFIQELGMQLTAGNRETVDSKLERHAEFWLLGEFASVRTAKYKDALEEWESLAPRLKIDVRC